MNTKQHINSFYTLGVFLQQYINGENNIFSDKLEQACNLAEIKNRWFTQENIRFSLNSLSELLTIENLENWLVDYNFSDKQKRVGVVMAGNLPLVGFHDFLSVLISGNVFVGKLSSKDNVLLKTISEILIQIDSEYKSRIFLEEKLSNFDAVIATGSDNSAKYFDYYFGKYPNIIRKNRTSFAVLTGNETTEDIELLGNDIFMYFGLGCRSVSKLYIPEGYNFKHFFQPIEKYKTIYQHNKYGNNHDYNSSIYLMNKIEHLDNGFVILKEDIGMFSPIGVLYYENYKDLESIKQRIELEKDNTQCVVSALDIKNKIAFGQTQSPNLFDYADNINTLDFLKAL